MANEFYLDFFTKGIKLKQFEQLDRLTKEGFLRRVVSDCGRLVLYNYTDKCTYERKWNKYTLSARGTVYELATGKVVARAFPKFFNFGELAVSKQRSLIKQKNFKVFEKSDGSLGIVFHYDGEWRVNTRGSFSSDQAIEGQRILDSGKYDVHRMDPNITYLAEIIYPENKIIVDYGRCRELIMLAMIDVETGKGLSYEDVSKHSKDLGFLYSTLYNFDNIDQVIKQQETLSRFEEGYVLLFENGERVKFKSKEYLKLAAAMSYMTPLHFWKNMQGPEVPQEFLESFPEELRKEADDIVYKLSSKFNDLKRDILNEFEDMKLAVCPVVQQHKGTFCKYIGINQDKFMHSSAFFFLINGQDDKLDEYVLRRIRPKGNKL